jgi:adenine-specific DNA-methyltransferase
MTRRVVDGSAVPLGPSARYLGTKTHVAPLILDIIGHPRQGSAFVDCCAGTGAVAREAAGRAWNTRVNDSLFSSSRLAFANVLGNEDVVFSNLGGYKSAIDTLNALSNEPGFVYYAYTPAAGISQRRYFTSANGGKIDAVRTALSEWRAANLISESEENLLVADLLVAATKVANTCGTFAAPAKEWLRRARDDLMLRPRVLLDGGSRAEVYNVDAGDVPVAPADVLYIDPPYNSRQYASYYHVLETIALYDDPVLSGAGGRREWQPSRFHRSGVPSGPSCR